MLKASYKLFGINEQVHQLHNLVLNQVQHILHELFLTIKKKKSFGLKIENFASIITMTFSFHPKVMVNVF